MEERIEMIPTADGVMPTRAVCMDGTAARPVVMLYMDALGIRPELDDMARRIAAQGYLTLLPNLFYRAGGPSFDPSGLPDHVDPGMEALNIVTTMAMVAADTQALLDYLGRDSRALPDCAGAIGFCMGGRHAITAAATFPGVVRAAASVHGGRLVSDAPDSAHRRLREIQGELYLAWADQDPAAPADDVETVRAEIEASGLNAHLELHAGALHGFSFPERFCFHREAAELTWTRCFDLFARNLIGPAARNRRSAEVLR